MTSENDVTCPLHDGVDKKIDALFEKEDRLDAKLEANTKELSNKLEASGKNLNDRITVILIIQILTAFMAGMDVLLKLITFLGKMPK